MSPTDEAYPTSCPFCAIANAYPAPSSSSSASSAAHADFIPSEVEADTARLNPAAFVVYSAPKVIAFLDIMPMARGHLLVATRRHVEKVGELEGEIGGAVGSVLPLLSRAVASTTGASDYNIVQNNGAAAAQVVPHIHFHIIPRNAKPLPEMQSKSWTMFGRGQRDDIDEDDAAVLARTMREKLREELRKGEGRGRL